MKLQIIVPCLNCQNAIKTMGKTIRLHSKPKPKYKYALREQKGYLPGSINNNAIIEHLAKNGITRNEWYADRSILFDSDKSIPADRLQKYVIVFGRSIDELQNHTVKATSILETHFTRNKKSKSLLNWKYDTPQLPTLPPLQQAHLQRRL